MAPCGQRITRAVVVSRSTTQSLAMVIPVRRTKRAEGTRRVAHVRNFWSSWLIRYSDKLDPGPMVLPSGNTCRVGRRSRIEPRLNANR